MNGQIEFKASLAVDDVGTITGMAWPFGTPDRAGDMFMPGAFKSAKPPLPMLFSHDTKQPLGVWDTIAETKNGLEIKGRMLVEDVPRAREVRALVKSGAITGISIGFIAKSAKARPDGGRNITSAEVVEASLVAVPSHPGARVRSTKSAAAAIALAEAINRAAAALKL